MEGIKVKKIARLTLSKAYLKNRSLRPIIKACPNLKHFRYDGRSNEFSCRFHFGPEDVMPLLDKFVPNLVSFDLSLNKEFKVTRFGTPWTEENFLELKGAMDERGIDYDFTFNREVFPHERFE